MSVDDEQVPGSTVFPPVHDMATLLDNGTERSRWGVLALLGAVIAAFVVAGYGVTVAVIAGIAAVIMLHELGHLLVAKACGMKVTEYFIGFGPRLWYIRRGETDYGIKPIPLGGYVKIPGMSNLEEIAPGDESRTYRNATFPRKVAVVSAGSAVHFLLAFLLGWGVLVFHGRIDPKPVVVGDMSQVRPGVTSPARAAGLRPGDVILSIDGKAVTSQDQFVAIVSTDAGKAVTLGIRRPVAGGHPVLATVTITPAPYSSLFSGPPPDGTRASSGKIGIVPRQFWSRLSPGAAVPGSVRLIGDVLGQMGQRLSTMGSAMWQDLTTNANNPNRPRSIIGAVQVSTQAEQQGIVYVALIFLELNISIGVLNMLPLLPLDGGHVAVAIYERIRTRRGRAPYRADAAKLLPLTYGVVTVLVVVGGSLAVLDLVKPVANPFG